MRPTGHRYALKPIQLSPTRLVFGRKEVDHGLCSNFNRFGQVMFVNLSLFDILVKLLSKFVVNLSCTKPSDTGFTVAVKGDVYGLKFNIWFITLLIEPLNLG